MRYYADLHVHSRHSRATSSDCDLEHLSWWGQRKGITVIATGDFTHPAWLRELKDKLRPAEPGLFRLREDLERAVADRLEPACRAPGGARFLLSVEISTIYKKGERTRKIHHLLYAPDFESAERMVARLAKIGNLAADGRPILGLDSRHLLEIALEAGEGCYLVPAHIWTPWFSVLGSKAGFDLVDECYGDLARHVFALETGLSSDPAMNWRLSQLDRFRLISSSDAHSPPKLGREATAFDTALDYFALRRALETGAGFAGTVEFFPEEGKYHLDGHRKCGVRWEPGETRAHGERCPVCAQPVTVGVLHRVESLADRPDGFRPDGAAPFRNLVPLAEVLGEIAHSGPTSRGVGRLYDGLLGRLGPELGILDELPPEALASGGASSLLVEAVQRMRAGRVLRDAGYDGEYGTIRLFTDDEIRRGAMVGMLFDAPSSSATGAATGATPPPPAAPTGDGTTIPEPAAPPGSAPAAPAPSAETLVLPFGASTLLQGLDPDQRAAAELLDGPLLIVAGPGTGKTRTLTYRIAHLVERGAAPERCLAITFTRRAAGELRERLVALLGPAGQRVPAMTFHALGMTVLREELDRGWPLPGIDPRLAPDFGLVSAAERLDLLAEGLGLGERKAEALLGDLSRLRRTAARPEPGSPLARALDVYTDGLRARNLLDFDDLVDLPVRLLEADEARHERWRRRHQSLSIDEYQDVDERQYRLARLLVPHGGHVCAIGDPDQSIYGFRGADVGFFLRFREDFPATQPVRVVRLGFNYRSTRTIVDGALQVIAPSPTVDARTLIARTEDASRITIAPAPTVAAEAEQVVHAIERLVGGASFFSLDSGRVGAAEDRGGYGFADFAVLYRTERQADALVEALDRSGMPYQRRSHRALAERPAVAGLLGALAAGGASPHPLTERLKVAAATLREEVATAADDAPGDGGAKPSPPDPITERDVDEALDLLLPLAARAGADLGRLTMEARSAVEVDTLDPRADRVALLTLHAAKGLEFPVVFIVGCEDGLLPLRFGAAPSDEATIAEERRLFYVGMTRARERLVLSHARRRVTGGRAVETAPSPFLRDIEERLTELRRSEAPARAPKESGQLKLF